MTDGRPNSPNNARLRAIFEASGLKLSTAITLFNRGSSTRVTESIFKDWLTDPDHERWREVSAAELEQAERAFGQAGQFESRGIGLGTAGDKVR